MPTIKLEDVTKIYRQRRGWWPFRRKTDAGVRNINLEIRQGEFVFVTGSSGAGKSTLLNLITGDLYPDRGKVYLGDINLSGLLHRNRKRSKAALAFGRVWQETTLVRKMTIEENLMLVARIGRGKTETVAEMKRRCTKVLGLVGMPGVEGKYPVELSLGECRRVELARAMINSPAVLVLDELTGNLDDDNIWDMFHLLTEINRKGTTVIMATHASQYVNILRRRVITLVDGCVLGDVPKGRYGDIIG